MIGPFDSRFFDELSRLQQEMGDLYGRRGRPAQIRAAQGSYPPVNVGVTADRVDVYLFAAGLDASKLDITIQQNLLTVVGERTLQPLEGVEYYRKERYDGAFRRVVNLPDDIDPDRVEARYRQGVLQISIQRREVVKPRHIQVK